jgi:heat shock protein HslJ
MQIYRLNYLLRNTAMLITVGMICACQPMNNRNADVMSAMPTLNELENLTYKGIGEAGTPVTLTDGEWHGKPFVDDGAARPGVGLVRDFRLTGDLSGDSAEETVVLLWSNSGGSGTFDYIAVVGRNKSSAPLNLATAALGDRVKIRSATIDAGGMIIIDTVQTGPDDAACCPGQNFKRTFLLTENTLNEVSSKDQGRQSLADLAGIEWTLQRFDRNETLAEDVDVTLIFAADRISGKSACNRYSSSVTESKLPGTLTVNMPMISTMMACPSPADEIERRYLKALQAVTHYSFLVGNLALAWRKDDRYGTMIFTPQKLHEN